MPNLARNTFVMIRILQFLSIILIGIGAGTFAQGQNLDADRVPPQSREQVQLSFSPLVK